MKKNIIDKIWEQHIVAQKDGHPAIFAIDLMLIHEVTSAQAFDTLREKGLKVFDTSRLLATLDHSIPTRVNRFQIFIQPRRIKSRLLEEIAKNTGLKFMILIVVNRALFM